MSEFPRIPPSPDCLPWIRAPAPQLAFPKLALPQSFPCMMNTGEFGALGILWRRATRFLDLDQSLPSCAERISSPSLVRQCTNNSENKSDGQSNSTATRQRKAAIWVDGSQDCAERHLKSRSNGRTHQSSRGAARCSGTFSQVANDKPSILHTWSHSPQPNPTGGTAYFSPIASSPNCKSLRQHNRRTDSELDNILSARRWGFPIVSSNDRVSIQPARLSYFTHHLQSD